MKSPETNPSLAVEDHTPEPVVEEADNGRRGQVPISVSDGDFSTPTQRKRTITRPRGLKTLEQPSSAQPPVDGTTASVLTTEMADAGAALPTLEMPRHEASVVDEFLAAPPTPAPQYQETPAPDPEPPPSELSFRESSNSIENPAAAEALRQSALVGSGADFTPDQVPADLTDEERALFSHSAPSDPETAAVHEILDQATAEILASTPPPQPVEPPSSAATGTPSAPANDTKPPRVSIDEAVEPSSTAFPGAEASLSPLAQTLANIAESMQGELSSESSESSESTVELDLSDAPLVPLPADTMISPPTGTPVANTRRTPPPIPTGLSGLSEGSLIAAGPLGRLPVGSLAGLPEALAERPRRAKRAKPWYEEVFDESYLRTLPFMTAEQTLQEVDFIESSLAVPRGSEILDVACGYGRHAIELVQRGLSVTGVDLSLPLLIRAADESQRRAVSVNFVHTDMREMAFERQFAGAYCMLTSFGYFDEESNMKVAEGIARALKPGGRFLIDVVNRDYIVGDLPARMWWEGDGCVVLEEVDFNFNTNRVLTHRSVVFEDGQQLEQEISVRVYSLHELGKLLRQAGFRVIEVSGSIPPRGHFFGAQSRNLLILAERRAE